jgi:hypothetical protein
MRSIDIERLPACRGPVCQRLYDTAKSAGRLRFDRSIRILSARVAGQ